MTSLADRFRTLDPEWRAAVAGASAAPLLVLAGLVIGLVEGGLLPLACQGLGCVFTAVVLLYAGIVAGVWLIVWVVVRLARRRWPEVTWRLWLLRVLAVASYAPLVWLAAIALE